MSVCPQGGGYAWSHVPSRRWACLVSDPFRGGEQGSYVQGWEVGMSRGGYTMGQVYQRGRYTREAGIPEGWYLVAATEAECFLVGTPFNTFLMVQPSHKLFLLGILTCWKSQKIVFGKIFPYLKNSLSSPYHMTSYLMRGRLLGYHQWVPCNRCHWIPDRVKEQQRVSWDPNHNQHILSKFL